jgi:hypothetical protein
VEFLFASLDVWTLSRGAIHRFDIESRPFLVRDISILPKSATSKILGLSSVAVWGRAILLTSSPEPPSTIFIFDQVGALMSMVFEIRRIPRDIWSVARFEDLQNDTTRRHNSEHIFFDILLESIESGLNFSFSPGWAVNKDMKNGLRRLQFPAPLHPRRICLTLTPELNSQHLSTLPVQNTIHTNKTQLQTYSIEG